MPVFALYKGWRKRITENIILKRLLTVLSLDILVRASGFILLPVYLRLMTQEEYGVFNYIQSIITTFSLVLNLGLYVSQSKLYHDFTSAEEKGKLIFSIHSVLFLVLIIIMLPVYMLRLDYNVVKVLFKTTIHYDSYRIWILLMVIVSVFSFMLNNYFYTSERIKGVKWYNLMRIIGINVCSVVFLYLLKGQDAVKVRFAVMGIMEALLLLLFYPFAVKRMVLKLERKIISKSIKIGFPIMLSALFGVVINFGDKFFLEKYVGFKKLSVYYLAFSCASIIPMIFNSLQNVWLPLFLKEKDIRRNIQKTNKLLLRLVIGLLLLSLMMMAGIVVLLYLKIVPPTYHEVLYVMPLLLIGQTIGCLSPLYSNYLVYFEKTKVVLWAGAFICLLSFTLNNVLVERWNMYGAAIASIISNTGYVAIYYFYVRYYKEKFLKIS